VGVSECSRVEFKAKRAMITYAPRVRKEVLGGDILPDRNLPPELIPGRGDINRSRVGILDNGSVLRLDLLGSNPGSHARGKGGDATSRDAQALHEARHAAIEELPTLRESVAHCERCDMGIRIKRSLGCEWDAHDAG
jgi:hypothetical protein